MTRVSATEAARNLADILNRAKYRGESFLIERNGEPVAEIRPAKPETTVADFLDFLRTAPPLDDEFASDMDEVLAASRAMHPVDRWAA